MRFWKLILVWLVITFLSLYAYHYQLKQSRAYDFSIHQALYQEFYQIQKQPAYIALSQSVFFANRYMVDRESVLKTESISPLTLSLCDEALSAKNKIRWQISVYTWTTLILALIGILAWLCLVWKEIEILAVSKRTKVSHLRHDFILLSLCLILLLGTSRWMSDAVSQPLLDQYDYQDTMAAALSVDRYFSSVIEGWAELTNQLYRFYYDEQSQEAKRRYLDELEKTSTVFLDYLSQFEPIHSDFLDFNSDELLLPTITEIKHFKKMISTLREWVSASDNMNNDDFLKEWDLFSVQFGQYLDRVFDENQSLNFESRRALFSAEAESGYRRMSRGGKHENENMLLPGFELYKKMGLAKEQL